jgi:S1-C subfamily serine protease
MATREIYDTIKRATVAITAATSNPKPHEPPFRIVGSGFCVHPNGIILTCDHVFESFLPRRSNPYEEHYHRNLARRLGDGVHVPVDMKPFGILVRGKIEGSQILMHQLGVSGAVEVKETDLALIKIKMDLSLFPDGFPTVAIADYSDLHEMMDVATCGYPFGDYLWRQTGSISSSFTKGALSTICPVTGIALEHLDSFQLDLTSFEGNSGGPVFCANTGKVFGVLRGGIREPKKDQDIVGLSIAEPVYPAFRDQLIEKLLAGLKSPA